MTYQNFLKTKAVYDVPSGFEAGELNANLFDYQSDIVRWALRRGRAALWEDCELGKTIQQLEWANQVARHSDGRVLILAPLAVAEQTVHEGEKFGIHLKHCKTQADVSEMLSITNYEKLHHFDLTQFIGIVLDESSCLKAHNGQLRNDLVEKCQRMPYRLACTATPAPNDYMELGNHAEFLGIMTRTQMLATFFVHDGGETAKWRLKGHAEKDFWKWICTWAVNIRKPSDLGYKDGEFKLPKLNLREITVESNQRDAGLLFAMPANSLDERRIARRSSISQRVQAVADLANAGNDQWLIWCDMNAESKALTKSIDGAIEVCGSDSEEHKIDAMMGFTSGKYRVLVTKPSIAGWGMNWQHCSKMAFVGLSDSYEQFYQAVRRCWRYGQKKEVDTYIITSTLEGAVVANIKRKEADSNNMSVEMVKNMSDITMKEVFGNNKQRVEYKTDCVEGDGYILHLGDCVDHAKKIESDSVHLSVFSPPFSSLYSYSNSDRDMGNCAGDSEFMSHFAFLVKELYRVTMPGRIVAIHCMNIPAMKERDGYIGVKDFRGDLIRLFQKEGFIYHSETCIWKDPLVEATRTKALGLMHKQLCKDSTRSRSGLPDYLVAMRKGGENPVPVAHIDGLTDFAGENGPTDGVISHEIWRKYASPVWMDIRQSNTLNKRAAREEKDEKHICPLQLDVIERALVLWSNSGETVLSPFAGIGSEGYMSVKMGRKFIGIELKESYFKQSVLNLESALKDASESMLIKS